MLIVCSGPDTYHARKKARELVAAFRAKHDPTGYSTEIVNEPDLQEILKHLGSPSLFAQKRMIRCDDLFESMKIADVRALAKRLEQDAEQTILLTVEEESLSPKIEKEFEKIKLVSYAHPLLTGAKFASFVLQRAKELNVSAELASQIAKNTDGDAWLADSELQKCSADPHAQLMCSDDAFGNVFDVAESFLAQSSGWRSRIETLDEPEGAVNVFLSQARSFARVKDGEDSGVHPYAVRKLSSLRASKDQVKKSLHDSIKALIASRQGLSAIGEENSLL